MNKRIAGYLKDRPPFLIEVTLNAVTRDLYEWITQVKGSYSRMMRGIELIIKARLPLKIKSDIMKCNLEEVPKIKDFVQGLGLRFTPNPFLNARLNRDLTPCELRISPQQALSLDRDSELFLDNCDMPYYTRFPSPLTNGKLRQHKLFSCAIGGGDGLYIDPCGNLIPCICIREPSRNLLKAGIEESRRGILDWVKTKQLSGDSICRSCHIRRFCFGCPGKALLEKGSLDKEIGWFCELAHLAQAKMEWMSQPHSRSLKPDKSPRASLARR
jgi:radical SAM protein with 4Fe4S-binding SPASM domain